MSTLGDALRFAGVPERISRPQDERFVTLKVRGGGAIERPIRDGKVPVPFTGYRLASGQFIYSRIDARNGAYAIVPPQLDGAVVSKDFPVFTIQSDYVDPSYLLHFMRAGSLQRQVQSASFGATNRQRISEDVFLGFELPLPSLGEQRRIAAILDRADAIRTKRRQVLTHLDALTQAIFHDLFDDWDHPTQRLDALIDRDDRLNYGVVQPGESVDTGVPLIRVSDLRDGSVDRHALKQIDPGIEQSYGRSRIRGTEILVSSVGSIGTIAVTSPADIGSNVARAITRVPISDPMTRTYVAAFLRTERPQRYFQAEARVVAQPTLNVKQLAETLVPVPPSAQMRRFAEMEGQVCARRTSVQSALAADDELFASLQSRAFRGEL